MKFIKMSLVFALLCYSAQTNAETCPYGQKELFIPIGMDPITFIPFCGEIPCGDDLCDYEIGEKCYTCEQDCGACNHECNPWGLSECKYGNVYKCLADPVGSNYWGLSEVCTDYCNDGECQTCNHECSAVGQKKCWSGNIVMCRSDHNGCRYWSSYQHCSYGCSNAQCLSPRPDLVPQVNLAYPSTFNPSGKILPGQWFEFIVNACNIGTTRAGTSQAKLEIKNSSEKYPWDETLYFDAISSLNPDSCEKLTWTILGLPGSDKAYYFTVTVDSGNSVDESKEGNNENQISSKYIDNSLKKKKSDADDEDNDESKEEGE